jgi:hypothetical protein
MAAKTSTKHPYAAIEHRVIDSPAFADLTFSARDLLLLIARQLTKNNNGHLQATFTYMNRFGFSPNTLSRATKELIAHGFICRTKSGGFHQGAAQFAVTWLSLTNTKGIFPAGFKSCAWRDWIPPEEKTRPPKVRLHSIKNGELTHLTVPKIEATPPPKTVHIELLPIYAGKDGVVIEPANTLLEDDCQNEYSRERDAELTADYWDSERGEHIKPQTHIKPKSVELERMKGVIQALRR